MSNEPRPGQLSSVTKKTRRAFVAYVDTHVGAHIAERMLALNYQVSAMCQSSTPTTSLPNLESRLASLYPRTSDPEAIRRALLDADVVIYHTPGCAEDSVRALRALDSSVFDTSNEKRFILVSSAQSWYGTTAMNNTSNSASAAMAASSMLSPSNINLPASLLSEETPDEDIAAALDGVSEDQYNRRIPHVRHQAWRDVEKMCAAVNSEGRIRTFVVFAGLVYGNGEDLMQPYMRQAWSLAPAGLPIFGTHGVQLIPMIHVKDLTTFVEQLSISELATQEGFPRYVFATDEGNCTWRSVIKAVNTELGNGRTFSVPPAEYGLYENVEQFTINLKVDAGQINELMPEEVWQCKSGFVSNVKRIVSEFRTTRNLTPHRVVILGPPSSGKSFIGKHLSELYQVPHLTVADIIAEYRYQEVELLEAIAVRKEERLAQKKAERLEEKRRTFVEERKSGAGGAGGGDNETSAAAQQAYLDPDDDELDSEGDDDALAIELTEEELKEISEIVEDENNNDESIQMMNEKISEVKRVCQMKWKPLADEVQEAVNPRDKLKAGAKQSSSIVSKQSAAAQQQQANKNAPGGKKTPGGGGRGGKNAIVEEETEEEKRAKTRLSDRALGFMIRWKLTQSAACRNQGYILDGWPKTVRQARLVFEFNEDGQHIVPEDPENEADLPLEKEVKQCTNEIFPEYVIQLQADDDFLLHRLLRTQEQASHNVPEHFQRRLDLYKSNFDISNSVMHFFESARTTTGRTTHVKHVNVGEEPLVPEDVPAKARESGFDPKVYPSLVHKIGDMVGPTRNLGSSPADALREAQRARNLADEERNIDTQKQREKADREAQELQAVKESRKQLDEKAKRLQSVERQMLEERKAPLKAYLMSNVIPVLTKGLMEVCIRQPDDPVEFLAEWLFRHNPEDHPEMYS